MPAKSLASLFGLPGYQGKGLAKHGHSSMAAYLFEYWGYLCAAFHVLLPAVQWEVKGASWPARRGSGNDKHVSSSFETQANVLLSGIIPPPLTDAA